MVATFCCVLSCDKDESPTEVINEQVYEYPEAMVISNTLVLQDAVEKFGSATEFGTCPADCRMDTTSAGNTLIDLLPGGQPLVNPYTGERDLPLDTAAVNPGEIGYQAEAGFRHGNYYIITGFGADSLIVELSNVEELEGKVVLNCYRVLSAANAFALDNDGYYPTDNTTVSDSGKTLVDYFPDGHLLANPFNKAFIEPAVWGGPAFNPGEIGYQTDRQGGYNVGCTITGADHEGGILITLYGGSERD